MGGWVGGWIGNGSLYTNRERSRGWVGGWVGGWFDSYLEVAELARGGGHVLQHRPRLGSDAVPVPIHHGHHASDTEREPAQFVLGRKGGSGSRTVAGKSGLAVGG